MGLQTETAPAAHVDDEDKTTTLIQGDGSNYKSKTTIINESGLYSLVLPVRLSCRDLDAFGSRRVVVMCSPVTGAAF